MPFSLTPDRQGICAETSGHLRLPTVQKSVVSRPDTRDACDRSLCQESARAPRRAHTTAFCQFRSMLRTAMIFRGKLTAATVPISNLPGLLGLESLRRNRCIIDFANLKLYMCGPDDIQFAHALPSGTDTFQCCISPSGHLASPCCEPFRNRAKPDAPQQHLAVSASVKEKDGPIGPASGGTSS